MNPFFRSAIVAGTIGALVAKAYDDGKTNTPPANVLTSLLNADRP